MTAICSTREILNNTCEKKDVSNAGQDEIVKKKVVSEDQVNFKPGILDQAIAKAFHTSEYLLLIVVMLVSS